MIRPLVASIAAMLLFMHPVRAGAEQDGSARFQFIPNVKVPGSGGKGGSRAVLLDTGTGQTWFLAPGAAHGEKSGPIWVPIKVKPNELEGKVAKSPQDTKKSSSQQASDTPRRNRNRLKRDFDDYDDDP